MEDQKNNSEIVKPVVPKRLNRKRNIIAFRANTQELALLNTLKKDWQLNENSEVLHRILGSFSGFMLERNERINEIKKLMSAWNIKTFELDKK